MFYLSFLLINIILSYIFFQKKTLFQSFKDIDISISVFGHIVNFAATDLLHLHYIPCFYWDFITQSY